MARRNEVSKAKQEVLPEIIKRMRSMVPPALWFTGCCSDFPCVGKGFTRKEFSLLGRNLNTTKLIRCTYMRHICNSVFTDFIPVLAYKLFTQETFAKSNCHGGQGRNHKDGTPQAKKEALDSKLVDWINRTFCMYDFCMQLI